MTIMIYSSKVGIEVNLLDINGSIIGRMSLVNTISNGFVCFAPVCGYDNLYRDIHEECYDEM